MIDVIDRSIRIQKFLEDEAVQWALSEMRDANYELFVKVNSDEERRMSQARAQILETFENTLRAIVSVGEREQYDRDKAERLSGDSH